MGKLCIIGVDNDRVLKDFVRAHVEYLHGEKVCVHNWYPDFVHAGRTIRFYYGSRLRSRLQSALPHFLYRRWVSPYQKTEARIHDALRAFFREHNVDVVLAEFGPTGAAVAPHLKKLGIPLIVHFHGHDAHRASVVGPLRDRYRNMFDYASAVMSVSANMTEALIELGADPGKVVTNPYGPRPAFFENRPAYASKTFLALGRFTDIKANYLTLMAFKRVLEAAPDARLLMVGDGELLETSRTLAEVWGIRDRVTFAGAVPHADVLPYFAQACAFVQHSVSPTYGDSEGSPVAILEAQAAGLAVISTRHAGIRDTVVHNETGFLVDERDVSGMAESMIELAHAPELCRTMGMRARENAKANFSMERHIGTLQAAVDAARTTQPMRKAAWR